MLMPKSFRIGRHKYRVEMQANSKAKYGTLLPEAKRVIIFNAVRGKSQTEISKDETFWHEVTHAILYDMGSPRWKDEAFVLAFSKRLNQVVHTAKLGVPDVTT